MSFNAQVSRTIKRIVQAKQTGALVSELVEVKRLLFFESGQLVGCRSSRDDERLGDIMVREGRLTPEQLSTAAGYIRSGRKMGLIMVELGFLKGGEIEGYVRLQILEVASAMLLNPCERLVFSDQIPVDSVTLSPITPAEVFIEGARRLLDTVPYRSKVLTDEFAVTRVADPPVSIDKLALTRDELAVWDCVDSVATTGEILKASPVGTEITLRTLIGLLYAGIVDRAERVTPEILLQDAVSPAGEAFERKLTDTYRRVQDQDHWSVLGLASGADFREIQTAYSALRDEFAPEKVSHIPDPALHDKIATIQARVTNAFLTLSAQSQAIAYEKLVEREEDYEIQRTDWETPVTDGPPPPKDDAKSKSIFARAEEAYQSKDYWTAIQLCRAAIELSKANDAEHYHLLGVALAHNPRWSKDAEKHLKIANNVKPWEARYLVTLAKFYHREGSKRRAQQLLEEARTFDPDYPLPNLDDEPLYTDVVVHDG